MADHDTPTREVLSLAEAARILGMHPDTARRHIRQGTFPPILLPRIGNRHRVSVRMLDAYLVGRLGHEQEGAA